MSYTVETLLDDRVKVNAEAKAALVAFRRSKPWRGTFDERLAKFNMLREKMAAAYGLSLDLDFHGVECLSRVGDGAYVPSKKTIVMVGKLSVVTFLHCLARARGMDHRGACRWSLSIFRRFFPLSFSRCRAIGFMLVHNSIVA